MPTPSAVDTPDAADAHADAPTAEAAAAADAVTEAPVEAGSDSESESEAEDAATAAIPTPTASAPPPADTVSAETIMAATTPADSTTSESALADTTPIDTTASAAAPSAAAPSVAAPSAAAPSASSPSAAITPVAIETPIDATQSQTELLAVTPARPQQMPRRPTSAHKAEAVCTEGVEATATSPLPAARRYARLRRLADEVTALGHALSKHAPKVSASYVSEEVRAMSGGASLTMARAAADGRAREREAEECRWAIGAAGGFERWRAAQRQLELAIQEASVAHARGDAEADQTASMNRVEFGLRVLRIDFTRSTELQPKRLAARRAESEHQRAQDDVSRTRNRTDRETARTRAHAAANRASAMRRALEGEERGIEQDEVAARTIEMQMGASVVEGTTLPPLQIDVSMQTPIREPQP